MDAIPKVEILCVKVTTNHTTHFIFVVYAAPYPKVEDYEALFETLGALEFIYNENILIVGDFNISKYASYLSNGASDGSVKSLVNFLDFMDLSQYNFIPNSLGRHLDLVISSENTIVDRADEILVKENIHHPALSFNLTYRTSKSIKSLGNSDSNRLNFRRANFPLLYSKLYHIDWDFLINYDNVNTACACFYNKLDEIFRECVPRFKRSNNTRRFPPWFNSTIIKNIRKKWHCLRLFKNHGDLNAHNEFKILRARIKSDIKVAYTLYMEQVEAKVSSDPSKFWTHVNSLKKDNGIPIQMSYSNKKLNDPTEIVNAFADFFIKSYLPPSFKNNHNSISTNKSMSNTLILTGFNEDEVLSALKKIKNKTTSGPDGIPAFLLKDCAQVLAFPLMIIFNLSLVSATFPSLWKRSSICPVFKKGSKNSIENYRPIALICNFAKVFEILLHDVIFNHVKNSISPSQHGFFKKRSTTTNLSMFTQYVSDAMDSKCQIDVVYTDFSKAFDKLDHEILLSKLQSFGFSDLLIQLLSTYLIGRTQHVTYRGFESAEFLVPSGVPQGSILGPLLFIIFINDITHGLNNCLLYADDLKIFRNIDDLADSECLQSDIDFVEDWCRLNRLPLNVDKCCVMSFTRKFQPTLFPYHIGKSVLNRSETTRDLGITFDTKLSFGPHITSTVSSAFKTLGFVIRNGKNFTNIDTLKLLFCALVRSKLEYAAVVWCPGYNTYIDDLEKVQRRFLKYLHFRLTGVYPQRGFPEEDLLRIFQLHSLEKRRICSSMIFLYNLIHYKIDCSNLLEKICFHVPRSASRRHPCFYLPTPRLNTQKFSPIYTMCNNYNRHQDKFDVFSDSNRSMIGAILGQ